jgi:ubiquinone/menaquinone biosynthesis C-methylase UbiE
MQEPAETPLQGAQSKLGHSEDYFGDYRDNWWNIDFLRLMAARLDWGNRRRILEVGSGAGHWTRAYAPFVSDGCKITCVDSDPKWSDPGAKWIQNMTGRGISLAVQSGNATALGFPDATFDFVTCQTVLIHIPEPRAALKEMVRVLKPGGLLLCVEPDNFGVFSDASSWSESVPLEDYAADFKYALARQRGRIARGLGDLSLGGRLPALVAQIGLKNVQVFLSDKVMPIFPPYETAEQVALLATVDKLHSSGVDFERDEVRRNYLAGGGNESDFEGHWAREIADRGKFHDAISNRQFDGAGGTLMYLISGSKI